MRSIGWFFMCLLFLNACKLEKDSPANPADAGSVSFDASPPTALYRPLVPTPVLRWGMSDAEPWPRAHPPGTLLVDRAGDLWMVENWLERRLVSGDDILGEIDLGNEDAIPMSEAEERCLVPLDDEYWYPASTGWYDVYSPVIDA